MLIPKITYSAFIPHVSVIPNVNEFSFVGSCDTTIDTISWSHSFHIGNPTVIYSNPDKANFSIFVEDAHSVVRVILEIVDTDGRKAKSTVLIVNDGINLYILGIQLMPYILPNGITVYSLDEHIEVLVGASVYTPPLLFTSYQIDYSNNGTYDVISPNADNQYTKFTTLETVTSRLSVENTSHTIPLDLLYTEASFEAVLEEPDDLIVTTNDSCDLVTVKSQTVDYVEKLMAIADVDNSEMRFLGLTFNQNCCNNLMEIKLAPRYQFNVAFDPSNITVTNRIETVGSNDYRVYLLNVELHGMNISPSYVDSIMYSVGHGSSTSLISTNGITSSIILEGVEVLSESPVGAGYPIIVENKQVVITTVEGFIYTIDYTITPRHDSVPSFVVDVTNIIYPPFPDGLTIDQRTDGTYINITPEFLSSEYFWDGVYQVTLNDSELSNSYITGCAFMDCETYCIVVAALAKRCNPMIKILYDALKNFKDCPGIPCTNLCDLYRYLETLIDECDCAIYQNNIVKKKGDCGCK